MELCTGWVPQSRGAGACHKSASPSLPDALVTIVRSCLLSGLHRPRVGQSLSPAWLPFAAFTP